MCYIKKKIPKIKKKPTPPEGTCPAHLFVRYRHRVLRHIWYIRHIYFEETHNIRYLIITSNKSFNARLRIF